MSATTHAVDAIERALDHDPFCPSCGAPTTVVGEGSELILRCSATIEPQGLIARVSAAMLPHIRHSIIDLPEELAA